uniref:Zf-RVT domain-containing protein n=1 Tax=Rhabditophanes sp. KR3021 TaxID=114890 RepID=A0AC35TGX8_9BILA
MLSNLLFYEGNTLSYFASNQKIISASTPYSETDYRSRLKLKLVVDIGQDEEFGEFVMNVLRQKKDGRTEDITYPLTCPYCERGCYSSIHWLKRSCRGTRTTAAKLNEDKEFIGKRFWEESALDNSAKCSHIYLARDIERVTKYTGVSAPPEQQKNEGPVTRF